MNATSNLEEAILDKDLRHINFFNGRLLSGEDLTSERNATQARTRHLGKAIGAGVVWGLEVARAQDSPVSDVRLEIKAGLAMNHAGQTLHLECDQTISLLRPPDPGSLDACIFNDCSPKAAGDTLATATGYFLLTIAPASQPEGKAPVSGLGNAIALCNSRFLTEGVKFQLHRLNVTSGGSADLARNAIAYQCFALTTQQALEFVTDPLSGNRTASHPLASLVQGAPLTSSHVPLAVLEWRGTEVGFVDQWSARRRISKPCAAPFWELLIGDQRLAEGEAMFLQFQAQIDEMRRTLSNPDRTRAAEHFRYLPPVGIIPLANNRFANGFHDELFFDTITRHPLVHIEGARLEALLRAALHYPPVDLNSHIMLWVYRVRENEQAVATATHIPFVQPYLIFTTGHMAFMGDPHFDVNRWDFSNWA